MINETPKMQPKVKLNIFIALSLFCCKMANAFPSPTLEVTSLNPLQITNLSKSQEIGENSIEKASVRLVPLNVNLYNNTTMEKQEDANSSKVPIELQLEREPNNLQGVKLESKIDGMELKIKRMQNNILDLVNTMDITLQSFSFKNENEPEKNALMNCGGTLIAEEGTLQFGPLTPQWQSRKCIWTVRAGEKSTITFFMENSVMDYHPAPRKSYISITPYEPFTHSSETFHLYNSETNEINLNDENHYSVQGPLVFVTLYYEGYEDISIYKLNFFGSSVNNDDKYTYSHYHFTQPSGVLNYPIRREFYSPNEIATFVINPSYPQTQLPLSMKYIALENHWLCRYDSLTVLVEHLKQSSTNNTSVPFFGRTGPADKDYRYCGLMFDVNFSHGNFSEYIIIFKSDEVVQSEGFNLSWGS